MGICNQELGEQGFSKKYKYFIFNLLGLFIGFAYSWIEYIGGKKLIKRLFSIKQVFNFVPSFMMYGL